MKLFPILLFFCAACNPKDSYKWNPNGHEKPQSSDSVSNQPSELLVYSIILKEPNVVKLILKQDRSIYATVLNDGTINSSYAEYLCQLVKDNGGLYAVKQIKLFEHNSVDTSNTDNQYGILLGEFDCK